MLLFGLAVLSLHKVGRVIEVGLQIASVAYGALLGVFLLGVLTRRANQSGAMVGMLFGFVTELYLWLDTKVPWTWYVAIGTVVTFGVGYAVSLMVERKALTAKVAKEPQRSQRKTSRMPKWDSLDFLCDLCGSFASFAVSFCLVKPRPNPRNHWRRYQNPSRTGAGPLGVGV